MAHTGQQKLKVAVLGGGSFGTALASIISANGHDAHLWFRNKARADACQKTRVNITYLPGYTIDDALHISSDMKACLKAADVVVMAIPSKSYRQVVQTAAPFIEAGAIVVSATKGIEAPNFTLMSDILEEELSGVSIAVLSGPTFAKEVIQNQHTGSVIASANDRVLELIPPVFSSSTFRIYTNHDRFGVELAGALKNIYAMVTGMASALGCGCNTQAMILTRSLTEMGRFVGKLGGDPMTLLGLAGVGDLILTCTSSLSRNYRVGHAIGSGQTLESILTEMGQVAEGVNTLKVVKEKADEIGVYMPLVLGLHEVFFNNQDISKVMEGLMSGEMTTDVEFTS